MLKKNICMGLTDCSYLRLKFSVTIKFTKYMLLLLHVKNIISKRAKTTH